MDVRVNDALAYPHTAIQRGTVIEAGLGRPWNTSADDVAGRHALLAVGSNASAEVMAEKMQRHDLRGPIYMSPVLLLDHDVVYSAHVSRAGSIPATLWPSPGTACRLAITWLDEEQCAGIDKTEPNYERMRIPASALRGRPVATHPEAYVSQHGALTVDGAPVALSEVAARGRRFKAMGQQRLQTHFADGDLATWLTAHLDDADARQATTSRLAEEALQWRP